MFPRRALSAAYQDFPTRPYAVFSEMPLGVDYELLSSPSALKEYMNISRINEIFLAAMEALNRHPQPHRRLPKMQSLEEFDNKVSWPWQYGYDKLLYEGKIEVDPNYNDATRTQYFPVNIRLSNDGFLYPHYHEVKIVDAGSMEAAAKKFHQVHHDRRFWVDIDEASAHYFDPIVNFVKEWMGVSRNVQTRIKYNSAYQRMDMYFQTKKENGKVFLMQITFEPGAPITLFDDPWQEL